MAVKPKRYNTKELTDHLRRVAATIHTVDDDGAPVDKGAALAELLFKHALGHEEEVEDDEGNIRRVYHKPASWAIQLIYDRLEGRTPQAVAEDENRIKASDRVRDAAKDRLNALAATTAGKTTPAGPPSWKPKKDE